MPELNDVVPAQIGRNKAGRIPRSVHLAAYEVYKVVYGPQQALIEGNCRGGFGTGELIGYLYARNFPKEQWPERFHEALKGFMCDTV